MLVFLFHAFPLLASSNRSNYIPTDSTWIGGPTWKSMALDLVHKQIFTAWIDHDRVDVLSTVDYHLIGSITVPSPSSVDISPDGTTLAVATSGAHVQFFSTATLAKTNDVVIPGNGLEISAFVYTANGNAMITALNGLFAGSGTGGTVYWNHSSNSVVNAPVSQSQTPTVYVAGSPMARSGDYSKIMLGDPNGDVQIINANTGQILWSADGYTFGYEGDEVPLIYSLAVNKDASRYALCTATGLLILDPSFNQIYQDQRGCLGMTFGAGGLNLYRDVVVGSVGYTQVMNVTTFATRNAANYFTVENTTPSYSSFWQAADTTGMVYGLNSNIFGGVIWIALDTSANTPPTIPPVSDTVQIVQVIDNIGSPQGGDMIRLLCSGINPNTTGAVSVTIGGRAATDVAVTTPFPSQNAPAVSIVTLKTPAGKAGLASVTVSANGSTDTKVHGFQFARSRKIFPFSPSPNFLLYDSLRNRLYAARQNEVEVIDVTTQTVLAPLVPASGRLVNSQFAGLSLSPDNKRLYIADAGANLIHILDLSKPGTGSSIDVGKAIGSSTPVSPMRAFELSNGQVLGSAGYLFLIDPKTGTGRWAQDTQGNQIGGFPWNSTNNGEKVLLTQGPGIGNAGTVGFWVAGSADNATPTANVPAIVEAAANDDGTLITVGGSTPGVSIGNPALVDDNLDPLGFLENHFDVSTPAGTAGLSLDASGALLYQPGTNGYWGSVEIDDLHQWKPVGTITFPEMLSGTYSPYTDHMLTTDKVGRTFFASTTSGITMMVLDTVPLSIGHLEPAFVQPQGGQTITVRGSGFEPGAVVSFGETKAETIRTNENTLTAVVPALTSGWQDITVTLSSGVSYTAHGLLQVLGAQTAPVITGFSPASLPAESGAVGDNAPMITIIEGSGFDISDAVTLDGEIADTAFIDSSHIQAVLPAQYKYQVGMIPFTVVSPYEGASNTLSFPVVNPVPVLDYFTPETAIPGGSQFGLTAWGTHFDSNSIIQWNGQNLSTHYNGGATGSGELSACATIPASLLQNAETAKITVFNPAPGGGVSKAINFSVSAAHPVVTYPASIQFGTVLLNTTGRVNNWIQNVGTAKYSLTSATLSSPAFTVQDSCNGVLPAPAGNLCQLIVQFTPANAGSFTGTLTIVDNAPGSPHVIKLFGTGVSTLVPTVTIQDVGVLDQTVSATVQGNANVGGPTIAGTAWLEYGTSPSLSTFTKSAPWSFTGANGFLSATLNGLMPATEYSVRIVVQTAGGTGKSRIRMFATAPAWPQIVISNTKGSSGAATVNPGQTATYSMVASDNGNGYTGTAALTCSGAPQNATCTVTPAQINLSTSNTVFSVKVSTTASTPAGAYLLTITGTTGGVEYAAYLSLNVK